MIWDVSISRICNISPTSVCCCFGSARHTTLNLDDELLAEAQRISGVSGKAALVRAALEALIERESARRLAKLGATEPQLKSIARRKSNPA